VPQLLCVASISLRKGQDLLIEALAALRELPWTLRLVGPPDAEPAFTAALQARIAALGLASRIVFTGALTEAEVADEYRRADLFVLPSRMETYGMVLSEAAAHGLPILSTRCGGIPDTLPAGAALLVAPDDAGALAAALRDLLTDAALRERLRQAARVACFPRWPAAAADFARALPSATS
jgi:glycosyltransferase involved in cell wall biosynthesis